MTDLKRKIKPGTKSPFKLQIWAPKRTYMCWMRAQIRFHDVSPFFFYIHAALNIHGVLLSIG